MCHNADMSKVPSDDVMRALYFQTNFEIVHMKFSRSQAFQGMFNAFDGTEVNFLHILFCSNLVQRCSLMETFFLCSCLRDF
jgi:hypothetical protein